MHLLSRAFAQLSSVVFLVSLMPACGSYETTKIKDYKLHVVNGTPSQINTFKKLILDFNSLAGMNALTYVDTAAEANSPINIIEGLKLSTDNKVGLGQWVSESQQENPVMTMPGQHPKRTVRYSMNLKFDREYFELHKGNDSTEVYARQKLFFHEVGHGLELDHVADQHNLMYEEISGDKDFDGFFKYVRSYLSDT